MFDKESVDNNGIMFSALSDTFFHLCFCVQGFAFVSYSHREDAAQAIKNLDGFGYDHLILKVEWAK